MGLGHNALDDEETRAFSDCLASSSQNEPQVSGSAQGGRMIVVALQPEEYIAEGQQDTQNSQASERERETDRGVTTDPATRGALIPHDTHIPPNSRLEHPDEQLICLTDEPNPRSKILSAEYPPSMPRIPKWLSEPELIAVSREAESHFIAISLEATMS